MAAIPGEMKEGLDAKDKANRVAALFEAKAKASHIDLKLRK